MGIQLSADLQKELDFLNSRVKLSHTVDGIFPVKYAFLNCYERSYERSFRTEFASCESQYSIVLFKRDADWDGEKCFARAVITDLTRLAEVIDLWVDKGSDIQVMLINYPELELYKPFSFKNVNPEIEQNWESVKNHIFNDTRFWNRREWHDRYEIMLGALKRCTAFSIYYPSTSHEYLCFRTTRYYNGISGLHYAGMPPYNKANGNFCVSLFIDGKSNDKYFNDIQELLVFSVDWITKVRPPKL